MTRFVVLVAVLLASSGVAIAQTFDHSHTAWTEVLTRHVANDGGITVVDYAAIQADASGLERYVDVVTRVTPAQFETWSEPQRLAFLINAYNALTVTLIVDNYPVTSIKDLGGWFSSPWKQRFFTLLGKERHLDDIEHGLIRAQFDEPRIHFAANCAASGCPPLRAEAYVALRLDGQLEDNARVFLRDVRRNRYEDGTLWLSELLDWYESDFTRHGGSLKTFVAARPADDPAAAAVIAGPKTRVRFLDYDWTLNGR
ncbi:MAG: DUF547 domain-containing protein [Vicinamibacterales bacterium]|nr:DUF547 domain-containing protein [Vicinamibacterales bacterium]